MHRTWFGLAAAVALTLSAACDGKDISDKETGGLDDFLPEIPMPTGEAQSVWAGTIVQSNREELIPGPATSGVPGDLFIRNSRARFVIQSATRVIGVVAEGGNVVDAVPLGPDGEDLSFDHFGEISMNYLLGRICRHDQVEILADGAGGGVAAIRARGVAAANTFVNIRGIGLLPIHNDLDPEWEDGVECATTYILEPNSPTMHVMWTMYNGGENNVQGPFGMLSDTGGEVGVYVPDVGFATIKSIEAAVESLGNSGPYVVFQGPEVAYGIIPLHEEPTVPNSSLALLGVSLIAFDTVEFLDILDSETNRYLNIAPRDGRTMAMDLFVGQDASDVEEEFRRIYELEAVEAAGTVAWDNDAVASEARVALFRDDDGDDELTDEDPVATFADVNADGEFSAVLPPGNYFARAEVKDVSRSTALSFSLAAGSPKTDLALELPVPVMYDYDIFDDENQEAGPMPARIVVIGRNPINRDNRVFDHFDYLTNVIKVIPAIRGTTTDIGDGADPQLSLVPGRDYRVLVMKGTEWAVAEALVSPEAGQQPELLEFRMRRVVDTTGYLATEYHVHSIGSPDSPVQQPDRVRTAAADGVEFFAATDHDFIADLQPLIEQMGLERWVRSIPGIETSPLVYGHFNSWPLVPDDSPNHGAIDWPVGAGGFAMIPDEIFEAARSRGAELVEVNHPRKGPAGASDVTQHFDRIALTYDYENRSITDNKDEMPVPVDWLRLPPEATLFSDKFNALEVWNGFEMMDTDEDGVREISGVDVVMRDWFNFLSFGKIITPIGNSDTHTIVSNQMGMPRTMVRVTDDSAAALVETGIVEDVIDTLAGRSGTPIDVVVTNGPHILVTVDGDTQPVGKVIAAEADTISMTIDVQSPGWAQIDTIEIFANSAPDTGADVTSLVPMFCFSSREDLPEENPCEQATSGGRQALTVNEVVVPAVAGPDFSRHEASITLDITAQDIVNREGATEGDAWLVIRVRGTKSIYPLLMSGAFVNDSLDAFIAGDKDAIDAALEGRGVPAMAFTSPIYVDFDGGGYTAPFAPQL